jgi:hypothetical protein
MIPGEHPPSTVQAAALPSESPTPDSADAAATPSIAVASWVAPNCDHDPLGEYADCPEYDLTDSCDWMWAEHDNLDALIENQAYIDLNRLKDCPQYLAAAKRALTGFPEDTNLVGKDIQPGTYQTTGSVTDCYWERERGGHIVANNFVSDASKITVTVRKGDDAFTTRGCGDWIRVR